MSGEEFSHDDNNRERRDLLDLVLEAAHRDFIVLDENGKQKVVRKPDPDILWWSTRLVNSHKFGRFAHELLEWSRMGGECYNNMHAKRAEAMAKTISQITYNFQRTIDAKSAETSRGTKVIQSTLLDKISRTKIEKTYDIKGDTAKSGMPS